MMMMMNKNKKIWFVLALTVFTQVIYVGYVLQRLTITTTLTITTATTPVLGLDHPTPIQPQHLTQQQNVQQKRRQQQRLPIKRPQNQGLMKDIGGICSQLLQSSHLPQQQQQQLQQLQSRSTTSATSRFRNNDNISSSSSSSTMMMTMSTMSAASIWNHHLEQILEASIHPADVNRTHAKWTKKLLNTLSATRVLQRGIRSSPHAESWIRLVRKVESRRRLQQNNGTATTHGNSTTTTTTTIPPSPPLPPPIQVVVFGGSIAYGRDCHKNYPDDIRAMLPYAAYRLPIRVYKCSWVFRLQHMLDTFLGEGVVQVHNLAAGGTDSLCAIPTLRYQLYQRAEMSQRDHLLRHGPDVIINAYSVNDNNAEECQPLVTPCLMNHSRGRTQAFTTTSLQSSSNQHQYHDHQHHRPVVIYLDDYTGGMWNTLLIEFQRHMVVQEEDSYHDMVGHVSSMTALAHLFVWSRPAQQRLLSPPPSSIHFGMPGHVAQMWMLAYAILQWTVDSCQDVTAHTHSFPHKVRNSKGNDNNDNDNNSQLPMVEKEESVSFNTNYKPALLFSSMANSFSKDYYHWGPPLEPQLRLHSITSEWTRHMQQIQYPSLSTSYTPTVTNNDDSNVHHTTTSRNASTIRITVLQQVACSFAFVAGPGGTHIFPTELRRYLDQHLDPKARGTWEVGIECMDGFTNSLGWVVNDVNTSHAILRVSDLVSPVQVVTTHYLKSYGEKWLGSLAMFQLYIQRRQVGKRSNTTSIVGPELVASWQLSGYHDHNTSVSHTHQIDIGADRAAKVGDIVELHLRLLNGTNFKLQALMMCFR